MKVFIGIPCLSRGGTEIHSLSLAKIIQEEGHDVVLVCYHEYNQDFVDEIRSYRIAVSLLNISRRINLFSLFIQLYKYFKNQNPDIVHIQFIAPATVPILAAYFARIPKRITTMHQLGTPYGYKAHLLFKLSSSLCTRVIFVSSAVMQSWIGREHHFSSANLDSLRKRKGIVYTAFDLKEYVQVIPPSDHQICAADQNKSNKVLIGVISRLSYEKGIDIFLQSLHLLTNKYKDFHTTIIGSGPDYPELLIQAENLGINKYITWAGEMSHSNVIKNLIQFDIVVIPSRSEGFGLTAIEALSCGKLVIASNTGGLKEIIIDKINGLLFENGDSHDLAAKLVEVIFNKDIIVNHKSLATDINRRFDISEFNQLVKLMYFSD
jgi:L-malate glycosyltransferase